MKFPVSLSDIFTKQNKSRSLSDAIETSEYTGKIELTAGKLKFDVTVFRQLFESSLAETTKHIQSLLRSPALKNVKAILMVGGFSDSPMLQHKVKTTFLETDVIIPVDASSSILRGALIFGHSPMSVTERVMKYIYGVSCCKDFEDDKDPIGKRVVRDIGVQCKDRFSKHVEKGQIVKVGEPQVRKSYKPIKRDQFKIGLPIFASELKNPRYTDQGCTEIGKITVNLPGHDGDLNRKVWVSFTFSGTEVEVDGEDEKTGRRTKVTANFLG